MVELTLGERAALEAAAAREPRRRVWQRYRAVLLAAERTPEAIPAALGCCRASVYNWLRAWQRGGLEGLVPRAHGGGRPARLAGAGAARLDDLLRVDPQTRGWHATGWTVPLLRAELETVGHAVGERTIRRMLHRLGWRWKRPKYVLGRPDPEYTAKKGRSRRAWQRS